MRNLSAAICIYVLILACKPCMDEECHVEASDRQMTVGSFDTASTQSNAEDCCSPFCVCSCCGHVYNVAPHNSHRDDLAISSLSTMRDQEEKLVEGSSLQVWQPPRTI